MKEHQIQQHKHRMLQDDVRAALEQFTDQIRWLYEPEFGDFKRKVGLYIQRLEEKNPILNQGVGKKILDEMKLAVFHNSNGDIELTRRHLLQLAREMF